MSINNNHGMKFTDRDADVDEFIRTEVLQLHPKMYTIEPSFGFSRRVARQAAILEQQRRARINIWFASVAFTPYAFRELWSLVRNDFISASGLPLGHFIVRAYSVFMSSFATYILLAGGILLALGIVGLPSWRKAELRYARK